MSNDIMENYTESKVYSTVNWTKEDIMFLLMIFYMVLLMGTGAIYLQSMHNQYKAAHNKWHGITNSPKKKH